MSKLRWTNAEREAVAQTVRQLARQHPEWSALDVLRDAQTALPPARRRKLPNMSALSQPQRTWLRALLSEARQSPQAPPSEPSQPAPAPLSQQLMSDPLDEAVDRLVGALVERILLRVRTQLHRRLHEVVVKEVERQHRPKVLVIGPKPDQQRILEQEFGDALALRFVPSDDLRRAPELAKTHEHVLVWTNFVSHGNVAGIHHKTLVTGGVSALKDKLLEIYAES